MTELARCNGSVLVGDGDTIGIVEIGGGWRGTAIFVCILVGVIVTPGGIALATANLAAGAGMLAVGILAIAAAVQLIRAKRRSAAAGLPAPWLVFDRATKEVRTGEGARLCSFAEVRIERVFQAGSSSKALAVYCPKKVVVARGTPFGDEVDSLEQALRRAVA